jgi:hypothetical protein
MTALEANRNRDGSRVMHPIILAYVNWSNLFKLVVFGGREDLVEMKRRAWNFYRELSDGA